MSAYSPGVLSLYANRTICLWVEDVETKKYLDAAWEDPLVTVLVAGGHPGVSGLVTAARQEGQLHVFGLLDRDFDLVGRSPSSEAPVGRLWRHEIENYLLDPEALAASDYNGQGLSSGSLAQRMEARAAELVPWMACLRVLHEVRRRLPPFPSDPALSDVRTLPLAETWLRENVVLTVAEDELRREMARLGEHADAYRRQLADGTWRHDFCGKEIFRPLAEATWRSRRVGERVSHPAIAADVGRLHRAWGQVPSEVAELRLALRALVGR